ncbi:hypothetical protein [Tropicibacter naphthalenivorans]|uniref:Cell envelope biogenesis protein OmpA n=1 Tax=Tropicibacter naphthalenivorans TaxID=441103 RepID=A0A0P1GYP3_9RHOB|nr:hypothetical protein [Tropicibacter naphthalenivorans]CUH82495.1 hypothetical protein TRN7648_04037 [Tropicibacter naphthalenivorans]SMD06995.1 hypothetical protein SAMN04488093_11523 [Tropicibacter naphthalenivorans]
MKLTKIALIVAATAALAGCETGLTEGTYGPDKSIDRGIDAKDLSQLKAGVWIDPNGCDHWIIDDGVEGYLSARLDKYGKPVCSGTAPPTIATGDFKGGSTSIIGDPL